MRYGMAIKLYGALEPSLSSMLNNPTRGASFSIIVWASPASSKEKWSLRMWCSLFHTIALKWSSNNGTIHWETILVDQVLSTKLNIIVLDDQQKKVKCYVRRQCLNFWTTYIMAKASISVVEATCKDNEELHFLISWLSQNSAYSESWGVSV